MVTSQAIQQEHEEKRQRAVEYFRDLQKTGTVDIRRFENKLTIVFPVHKGFTKEISRCVYISEYEFEKLFDIGLSHIAVGYYKHKNSKTERVLVEITLTEPEKINLY